MKGERLDQILLRLGYVNEDQIKQALLRQKAQGGRIGSHLLYFKFLTLDQLLHGLSEKFGVPPFRIGQQQVATAIARRLKPEVAQDLQVLPFSYDAADGELSIVAVEPDNQKMLERMSRIFGARRILPYVAPESVVGSLIAHHYHGKDLDRALIQIIELPELFADGSPRTTAEAEAVQRNVLLVSRSRALQIFLAPIFWREGWRMVGASDLDQLSGALKQASFERILVADDMSKTLASWIDEGRISLGGAEVNRFSNISAALLDQPLPYPEVMGSLLNAGEAMAELRLGRSGAIPHRWMMEDIERIGRRLGLGRAIADALKLAACLLLPGGEKKADGAQGASRGPVAPTHDLEGSIAIAARLRFPLDIAALLRRFDALYSQRPQGAIESVSPEIALAAEVLALVWYRHVLLARAGGGASGGRTGAEARAAASALRGLSGRLASLQVIEAYVQILTEEEETTSTSGQCQIFVVSTRDEVLQVMGPRFSSKGFRTVLLKDFAEAVKLCRRHAPAAVLLDGHGDPKETLATGRALADCGAALYAIIPRNDPTLTLELLDAGFDDVLAPPHDPDIIVARVAKSLRIAQHARGKDSSGRFHAAFGILPFIDLIQTLGQSRRSVRLNLKRGNGETAVVHLREGAIIHAQSGRLAGREAIYAVIAWREDGEFTAETVGDFPAPNISEANETLLLEGCRILDEASAIQSAAVRKAA